MWCRQVVLTSFTALLRRFVVSCVIHGHGCFTFSSFHLDRLDRAIILVYVDSEYSLRKNSTFYFPFTMHLLRPKRRWW